MSDPAEHTDGLAALQARRTQSRKRELPKSQNPTTLPPYKAPEVIELDAVDPPARHERLTTSAQRRPTEDAPVSSTPAAKAPSRKIGLYLEEPHEDFMEAVRVAGNALRPKVNLSGSAVVRLAMDRLMDELSAEDVRDALVAKPMDPALAGRPRR